MKTTSKQRQLRNCLMALWRWAEVDPKTVNLARWRCGTQACFGGHLATWPEFQAQGVRAGSPEGEPQLRPDLREAYADYFGDRYLFGDPTMFNQRSLSERLQQTHLSDYDVVAERLERRIVELTS